ncbi:TetR/AcrR family transcriptional regulator [Neisseriaceae bacterium JH1-16]|nr:TetR/AcrR family transcriptional regulator [Neisseriaceae bacterium JH1-16]
MSKSEQLVDTALQLFYRQGFHATGVEQLSREGEVTKKTLYRYFPTKEALVEAALQRRDAQFMDELQRFVAPLPLAERPAGYIDFIVQWVQQPTFHGCFFINAVAEYAGCDEPAHRIAAAHKRALRSYLAQLCTEAGLEGAAGVAAQLFLLGEGLIVACQVEGPEPPLLAAAQATAAGWTRQGGVS